MIFTRAMKIVAPCGCSTPQGRERKTKVMSASFTHLVYKVEA
jgi:hypothetical protein